MDLKRPPHHDQATCSTHRALLPWRAKIEFLDENLPCVRNWPIFRSSVANTLMTSTSTQFLHPVTAAHEGKTSQKSMKVIGIKANDNDYETEFELRVIIKNNKDEMIILSAKKKDNYYKLPGGGIDDGEDDQTAVEREAMEGTGCKST